MTKIQFGWRAAISPVPTIRVARERTAGTIGRRLTVPTQARLQGTRMPSGVVTFQGAGVLNAGDVPGVPPRGAPV